VIPRHPRRCNATGGSDDLYGVTPRISSEDAERLISGSSGVDGPAELADLSAVLGALRGPAEPAELAALASALAAFRAAAVTTPADNTNVRTLPMIKKRLTRKTLAAIGVVTLVSAGAAAAAGGVPSPFSAARPSISPSKDIDDDESTEESADDTAAPDTAVDTTPTTDEPTTAAAALDADETADSTAGTDGQGPDVNGPAKFGLCTAFAARTKHDDVTTTTQADATAPAEPAGETADSDLPVPFQNLTDAADAAGQTVAEFCADAVPGGEAHGDGGSDDNPSATAPGKSDDNPSATAPGKSKDHHPSGTASGKSHGHTSTTQP